MAAISFPRLEHSIPEIIPFQHAHTGEVARLHLNHLQTPFKGKLGQKLLRLYYVSLIESSGASGFVALVEGRVIGFICGVWNKKAIYYVLLKHYALALLFWGTIYFLIHPALLLSRVKGIVSRSEQHNNRYRGYELRPLVVDPDFRGKGAAINLVNRLIQDADRRGFELVFLYTEEDNTVANAFYRKVGFKFTAKYCIQKAIYLRYEISTK